jgi:flavin reductase (DIM6/NTAB) family NADH-FMN oxidoreductase RutF
MLRINPKEHSQPEIHRLLLGGIGPRPIALVSTHNEDGTPNLSPFSFFNCFGSNPPIVAFSASRRGRDATFKDTYNNLIKSRECVIQAVTYDMVEQISLASTEYPPGVDEFIKCGLTPSNSEFVKPKRVKESPFQMECVLRDMMSYGEGGASANIAICEVLLIHVAEDIIKDGLIQPDLIDLVARMSGDYYCRASGDAVFRVAKPVVKKGIGFDQLPGYLMNSDLLTANNLGRLANVEVIPSEEESDQLIYEVRSLSLTSFEADEAAFNRYLRLKDHMKMLKAALVLEGERHPKIKRFFELTIKTALENSDSGFAWKTAVYLGRIK